MYNVKCDNRCNDTYWVEEEEEEEVCLTPEVIKEWYERNTNTNAFTDNAQAALARIIDMINLNGGALGGALTDRQVKAAYERNLDTNVFTDVEKLAIANLINGSGTGGSLIEKGGVAWLGGVSYKLGDTVTYLDVAYRCVVDHTSVSWASNKNNWEFIIRDPGMY